MQYNASNMNLRVKLSVVPVDVYRKDSLGARYSFISSEKSELQGGA